MDHHEGPGGDRPVIDLTARRPDVVRRLIERGVPATTIRTLLPDWEPVVAAAISPPASTR